MLRWGAEDITCQSEWPAENEVAAPNATPDFDEATTLKAAPISAGPTPLPSGMVYDTFIIQDGPRANTQSHGKGPGGMAFKTYANCPIASPLVYANFA